jgi:hypothetical protein
MLQLIDWLFSVLRPAQEYFTYMETCCKFRPMLGAQGFWAGRDPYRATPAATRNLNFSGLIRRTAPINRLLRIAAECGGPILIRILTGPHFVAFYDTQGGAKDLFLPGPSRVHTCLDNSFYNILWTMYMSIYLEKFPGKAQLLKSCWDISKIFL